MSQRTRLILQVGWGLADSDGDLRDQVPTGGWVLSHPVMQGTASPTTLHHPRAEGWRIRSAELGSSVCGMRGASSALNLGVYGIDHPFKTDAGKITGVAGVEGFDPAHP